MKLPLVIKKQVVMVRSVNISNEILISLFEVFITALIGILFYWPLKNETIAWVTWVIGLMLMLNRVLGIHQARSSLKDVNGYLERMAQVTDLRSECNVDPVRKMLEIYLNITEQEFRGVKDGIVAEALVKLNKLRNDKRSEQLATSEYYEWLFPILDGIGKRQTIKAISCMFAAEWDDTPAEQRFFKGNQDAAERGAIGERIFITSPDVLSKVLTNKAVEAHCEEKQKETGLIGYYVEREKLSAKEPDLLKMAGDGFIIFDSRVALIDEFGGDGIVRGRVTMNESEIQGLEKIFQRLKVHASRLNKELLKPHVVQVVAIEDHKTPSQLTDQG
jgi:hypothetical protein